MLLQSGVGVAYSHQMKKRNRGPSNSAKSWIWERGRRGGGVGDRGGHRGRPALAHLSVLALPAVSCDTGHFSKAAALAVSRRPRWECTEHTTEGPAETHCVAAGNPWPSLNLIPLAQGAGFLEALLGAEQQALI